MTFFIECNQKVTIIPPPPKKKVIEKSELCMTLTIRVYELHNNRSYIGHR